MKKLFSGSVSCKKLRLKFAFLLRVCVKQDTAAQAKVVLRLDTVK